MVNNLKTAYEEKVKYNKPVKLHLGCGPHVWEDWINVEGEFAGNQPGVILFDITASSYPLPSNSVDEIFTSHVIEHIDYNHVLPMLKEWHRILKPGGFVSTEWPDILKACKYILDNPKSIYSERRKERKAGIGAIFGMVHDYKGDIAMLHKWGYSAESMIDLKLKAGFRYTEVLEPIQQKTKNDSRVVGYK